MQFALRDKRASCDGRLFHRVAANFSDDVFAHWMSPHSSVPRARQRMHELHNIIEIDALTYGKMAHKLAILLRVGQCPNCAENYLLILRAC
jgi:hypothetical protein